VYTVPVRTTADCSYSELVEQPPRIAGVPIRIAAFKTDVARRSLFALRMSNTPTGNLTFEAFIIPQHAQSLGAKPKLVNMRECMGKKLTSSLTGHAHFTFVRLIGRSAQFAG
jgi:hypothetical protein